MPLYDCECARGHRFERQIPLAEFEAPIICACGTTARRLISRPRVLVGRVDYEYACPITGEHIRSKHQHEENLKRHGCRVLETGEKEFNERRRQEAEKNLEQKIEQTVEREIALMPSEKRERLATELEHGVDVSIERR